MQAGRNLKGVNILPGQGANVYDILRHHRLAITLAGIEMLKERLS
ncbi:MAG: 50S ribosomal protein L4 [Rhodobacteraceae bacterium]|nr:50S ribosomal protein L4 [Paracoccaceae bacterium]